MDAAHPSPTEIRWARPSLPSKAEPLAADSEGDLLRLPADVEGAPALLLVGYVQEAQFDIDRWLFGVLDADLEIVLFEIPAARGMAAQLASGFIDGGMRRGIPKAEWGAVATTYGSAADAIAEFTGLRIHATRASCCSMNQASCAGFMMRDSRPRH